MRKVVIITGASRGIGRQCAIDLSYDYDVVINYNKSENEAKELLEIVKNKGSNAIMIRADVSDREQVDSMVDKVVSYYGRIDALINNAGIARQELFTDVKSEDMKKMTDINLGGVFNCTQAVLKEMINKKQGRIINMSSALVNPTIAAFVAEYTTSQDAPQIPHTLDIFIILPCFLFIISLSTA